MIIYISLLICQRVEEEAVVEVEEEGASVEEVEASEEEGVSEEADRMLLDLPSAEALGLEGQVLATALVGQSTELGIPLVQGTDSEEAVEEEAL